MIHLARRACIALFPLAAFAQAYAGSAPDLASAQAATQPELVRAGAHALATRHVHAQALRAGARRQLAALPAGQELQLSILLSLRNQADLDATLADLYNPQSPNYRHFLDGDEFTARFGPTQADYAALISHLKAKGLKVTKTARNRLVIDVSGQVKDVEQAFHVKMGHYQHPNEARTYFAPDREPTIDALTPIWRVAGLDDFSQPHPLHARQEALPQARPLAGTGPGGQFTGTDMRKAYYGGTALTGAGQSVALLQFGPYWSGDLQNYFNNTRFNNTVPVNNILLDGTSMCNSACDDAEQVLDIAQVVGIAPNLSQVRVYIGHSDVDIFNRMATDNISKTISVSWGWGPADPGSDDPIFRQFAAQGQTVFVASGDSGAYTTSASYPADDVNVTAVGGTDLTTNNGAWAGETSWSGSGGGYAGSQPIPSWQVSSIDGNNHGSTSLRNVPDVAAEGNFDNYACGNGTCGGGWGGTSFASPRWAAFIALVNQQAASAGKPPVGFLNPRIYAIGKGPNYGSFLHDVTSGSNGAFSAAAGYDLVTGWGSPNGQNLIDNLAGIGTLAGGTYVLVNPNSNKALDVYGASTADGAVIDLWEQNNSAAQKWTVRANNDGTYALINPNSNKALDVYGAATANGSVVDTWEQNNTGAQKWSFRDNGDGTYTLVNPQSNKALDVYGAATDNGAKIDLWEINGTPAQKWTLVPAN